MRKIRFSLAIVAIFFILNACKKSDSAGTNAGAKTVANLSGTYKVTAIIVSAGGLSFDEFATLDDCQKDNTITLNTDLTAVYTDAGTVCVPNGDATGNWSLSSNTDSLTVTGVPSLPDGVSGFIKTWDGKSLVLVGSQTISNQIATTTLTLAKQ